MSLISSISTYSTYHIHIRKFKRLAQIPVQDSSPLCLAPVSLWPFPSRSGSVLPSVVARWRVVGSTRALPALFPTQEVEILHLATRHKIWKLLQCCLPLIHSVANFNSYISKNKFLRVLQAAFNATMYRNVTMFSYHNHDNIYIYITCPNPSQVLKWSRRQCIFQCFGPKTHLHATWLRCAASLAPWWMPSEQVAPRARKGHHRPAVQGELDMTPGWEAIVSLKTGTPQLT